MRKTDLSARLANQLQHISESVLKQSVNIITEILIDAISQHQRIEVRGFGCLTVRKQAPRRARNPKTGVSFMTDGSYKIHYKPSILLKQRLNKST